jgi:hypothetical protein
MCGSPRLEFATSMRQSFDFAVIHACFISFQANIKWSQVLILFLNTLKLPLMNPLFQFVAQSICNFNGAKPCHSSYKIQNYLLHPAKIWSNFNLK